MFRTEQMPGRMVDVHQDGVEFRVRCVGHQPVCGTGQLEEVAMHEAAARIGGQRLAEGQQAAPVPLDHRKQVVDDDQAADLGVFQHGRCGVAEAQSADRDGEIVPIQLGQAQAPARFRWR